MSYSCKGINELSSGDLLHINLIYSRLVLVHNKKPLSLIQNIKNNCKKNTIFVFEEPITSESECFPLSQPFNKHLELYCELGQCAGFDFDFGKQLTDLIAEAGLSIEGIKKTKSYFLDYTTKLIAYRRTKECANKYIHHNMITREEIDILLTQLAELANNKSVLVSGVSMMQVWGSVP